MPPRIKITKEMVEEAAFHIIQEKGYENLNVRNIAQYLSCSTQPVLYTFKNVDEIKEAAYALADQYHSNYILPKENDVNPLLALGMNYIQFGYEQKHLFRFLFQTNQFQGMNFDALVNNPELKAVLDVMSHVIGCDQKQSKELFMTFFCVVHGLASLYANNAMEYDEKQARTMLENVFYGMIHSMKEGK